MGILEDETGESILDETGEIILDEYGISWVGELSGTIEEDVYEGIII